MSRSQSFCNITSPSLHANTFQVRIDLPALTSYLTETANYSSLSLSFCCTCLYYSIILWEVINNSDSNTHYFKKYVRCAQGVSGSVLCIRKKHGEQSNGKVPRPQSSSLSRYWLKWIRSTRHIPMLLVLPVTILICLCDYLVGFSSWNTVGSQ